MKNQMTIMRFFDPEAMTREAARYVSDVLLSAVRQKGFATLVLSGGTTPRRLYHVLTTAKFVDLVPWHAVDFFWGDERCVPSGNPGSNYKMAIDTFFSRVSVPPCNIHRIQTELGWQESAVAYEDELKRFFEKRGRYAVDEAVLFDIVLLGLGTDGHTASLFLGSPALDEHVHWAAAVEAPIGIGIRKRITLTLPILNRTRYVLFLVAGKEKKRIMENIVREGDTAGEHYPAARIHASEQVVLMLYES